MKGTFYADFSEQDDLDVAKNFLLNILAKVTSEILVMDSRYDNSEQIEVLADVAMRIAATLHSLRFEETDLAEYLDEDDTEEYEYE